MIQKLDNQHALSTINRKLLNKPYMNLLIHLCASKLTILASLGRRDHSFELQTHERGHKSLLRREIMKELG